MRRSASLFVVLAAMVLVPSAQISGRPPASAARPSEGVRALLRRAAREPIDRQLQTLDEAARVAEQSGDTAGALEVADEAHTLGARYYDRHELAVARELYQRAVRIRERLTPDSFNFAAGLNNLGNVALEQGDLATAEPLYRRSLAIKEKLEPGSLEVAYTLNNLGNVAYKQSRFAAARDFYERSLAIKQRREPNSRTLAITLNNLGIVTARQGDRRAAQEFYQRALDTENRLRPNSLGGARTLNNLGNAAREEGDLPAARSYYRRALELQERRAPDSLGLAETLNNLGLLLTEMGDAAEAATHLRRALRILDQQAANSNEAATVSINLARLLLAGGDAAEAAGFLERAEKIQDAMRSVPQDLDTSAPAESIPPTALPQVRFLSPNDNSVITGDEVTVSMALISPLPLARYRVTVNGRPIGPEQGFSLPPAPGEADRQLEKGRILQKGEDRTALSREVPPEIGRLVQTPELSYYQQVRHTLPVEESDGAVLRVAVSVEAKGGGIGNHVLQLRRPQGESRRGALRVLAIGISAYTRLPKLRFADDDARDLAGALEQQGGAGKLYRSATVKVLTDAQATLPAIRQGLTWLTRDVQPGETLILFLSGHGLKDGDTSYFAPVGLSLGDVAGTGLPWKEVLARLEVSRKRARSVWVLADCCRAAPDLRERRATVRDLRRGAEESGNLVICTASSGDAPSYESERLKHGLFTLAWLEVLRGQAPSVVYRNTPQGRVLTLFALQFAVESGVSRLAEQEALRQYVEFPQMTGSFSSQLPVFMPISRSVRHWPTLAGAWLST